MTLNISYERQTNDIEQIQHFEGHVHNDGGHEMAIHVAFLHSQVGNTSKRKSQ